MFLERVECYSESSPYMALFKSSKASEDNMLDVLNAKLCCVRYVRNNLVFGIICSCPLAFSVTYQEKVEMRLLHFLVWNLVFLVWSGSL